MPVHSCSSRALVDTVEAIEAKGERIVSSVRHGDDTFFIFTYVWQTRPAKGIETR